MPFIGSTSGFSSVGGFLAQHLTLIVVFYVLTYSSRVGHGNLGSVKNNCDLLG